MLLMGLFIWLMIHIITFLSQFINGIVHSFITEGHICYFFLAVKLYL